MSNVLLHATIALMLVFCVGDVAAQPQNITKVEKVCVTNDAGFVLNWYCIEERRCPPSAM